MTHRPAPRVPGARVDRTPSLPGAPRERRVKPLDDRTLRRIVSAEARGFDPATRTGVNASSGAVWGATVAPVTGRKARKSPGWSSNIAGGSHIVAPGV